MFKSKPSSASPQAVCLRFQSVITNGGHQIEGIVEDGDGNEIARGNTGFLNTNDDASAHATLALAATYVLKHLRDQLWAVYRLMLQEKLITPTEASYSLSEGVFNALLPHLEHLQRRVLTLDSTLEAEELRRSLAVALTEAMGPLLPTCATS